MELGLFKVKQTTITSSSGSVHITNTVRVTPKGVQYIMNKFLTGKIVV
jgi:anti-repressor protein